MLARIRHWLSTSRSLSNPKQPQLFAPLMVHDFINLRGLEIWLLLFKTKRGSGFEVGGLKIRYTIFSSRIVRLSL